MSDAPRYSVVIPVSDRVPSTEHLRAVTAEVQRLSPPGEILLTFDGHRLGGAKRIREQFQDEDIQILELHQDHGEGSTLRAGLQAARGDFVMRLEAEPTVTVDAVPLLARYLESGAECVFLERVNGNGKPTGGWRRKLGNRLLSMLARTEVRDLSSLSCGFTREVASHLPTHGNLHRYLPVLVPLEGFQTSYVPAAEAPQSRGRRQSLFSRSIDLLAIFFLARGNQSPFRFFASIGVVPLLLGIVLIGNVVYERFAYDVPMASRPLVLLALLLISLGVQAFAIGFLGELMVFLHYRDRYPDHAKEL